MAELDARYTKELADANATIESIRVDVSLGVRLQVARHSGAKSTTEPAAWAMEKAQDLQQMLNSTPLPSPEVELIGYNCAG